MLKSIASVFDEQLPRIKKWIQPPVFGSDEANVLRPRTDDETSTWILEESRYKNWLSGASAFLWLCGPPGCGKSVTASVIAQKLRQTYDDESTSRSRTFVSIAYIFKNDETKRDALSILRTFAWHLVRDSSLRPEVKAQIVYHWRLGEPAVEHNTHTSENELFQALVELLRDALGGQRAYLVVDGLDECHNPYQAAQTLVEAIENISRNCEVRTLIVSQKLPDLSSILSEKFICIDLHEGDTRSKCEQDLDRILASALQRIKTPLIRDNYAAIKRSCYKKPMV